MLDCGWFGGEKTPVCCGWFGGEKALVCSGWFGGEKALVCSWFGGERTLACGWFGGERTLICGWFGARYSLDGLEAIEAAGLYSSGAGPRLAWASGVDDCRRIMGSGEAVSGRAGG